MFKKVRDSRKKVGLSPGTLLHVGDKKIENIEITHYEFNEEKLEIKKVENIEETFGYLEKPSVTWINIYGLHDTNEIEKLGNRIKLHPLIMEDILNTHQRPVIEITDNYIFCILKMITFDESQLELNFEHVSLVIGSNFVITFQEQPGDVFDPLRKRLENANGRLRKKGSDYLAYALIDIITDHYFVVLETIGDQIEELEDVLIENPSSQQLQIIHKLKRELIIMRKSIWPLRYIISSLERTDSSLIEANTRVYIRDLHDHTIQVIDTVETFRDMISGILDIYLSSINNRMNDIMKVLTMFASIFIPLTFIAGVYGMNFEYMPELGYQWSYFIIWGVIILISAFMLIYFKRKKWL